MYKEPFLIVFEGIDGSGKTTQADLLFKKISYLNPILLKEPSFGDIGLKIREILHKGDLNNEKERDKLYSLFLKDREEQVKDHLKPALDEGKIVILDRYILSTFAYQGSFKPFKVIEEDNLHFPKPDLVLYLDIDIDDAFLRFQKSKKGTDSFENKEFLIKVKERYEKLIKFYKKEQDILVLDATIREDFLSSSILTYVTYFFGRKLNQKKQNIKPFLEI